MKTVETTNTLFNKTKDIRKEIINLSCTYGNHHIAPALSAVELLVVLYESVMGEHDQFILSKGHGSLALFAVLRDRGYNPHISGHPDIDVSQGIQCTSGSLGHGIAIAAGKALARKIKHEEGAIYVLVGDGECQEGVVWETLNIARRFKLDNLVIIIDHNKMQALGRVEDILDETNLSQKCEAFGAQVIEVDGHNCEQLIDCFNTSQDVHDKPIVVVAHTIKGKGISFMEHVPKWHVCPLIDDEHAQALTEIDNA